MKMTKSHIDLFTTASLSDDVYRTTYETVPSNYPSIQPSTTTCIIFKRNKQ